MKGNTNRYRTLAIAGALVAALAGVISCGGDGTTDPPPPPPPPPPAPVAPVAVGSIPAQVITAGESVTVDVSPFFSDPDGGALTYTAASSAPAVLTVSLTGSSLTVTAVAPGTATVTVTATDPDGLTATQSAEVTVEAANEAPTAVGAIPAQGMTVGQTVTLNIAPFFSDPDGDALAYTAESSDAGVVATSMSGSSLTVTAVSVGSATVTVTAADPDGLTATQSAAVTVEAANEAPTAVGAIPAQGMTVGQTVTVNIAPFFSDPDGDALAYTAESSDAGVVATSMSGSSLTVTAVSVGSATVTVTAADPDGLTATQSAAVTVEAANEAPTAVGAIPAQGMTVGQTVTVNIAPFFSDPDGDALAYTAESSDAGVVATSMSGSSLTVTAVSVGSATVTVTAADPDGLTATQSAAVTVEAANEAPTAVGAIPAQGMTVGQTVTVNIAPFFSDPDGDALAYTAESSDAGVVATSMSGSSLTVTAVSVGSATVTVTATDPDGLSATQSAEVAVGAANQPPEPVGAMPPQTITAGMTATVDVSAFFSDPDGHALTYAAESSNPAVVSVSISGSSLTVTAVAVGSATVTVTASDPGGLTATQSAAVTVEAANRAPTAVGAIPPQTMSTGRRVELDVSAFFSDPDGDDLTYTAGSSDGAVITVSVSGSTLTVMAVGAGTATASVIATDPGGLSASQSAEVTVEDAGAGFRDDFDSAASLDDWEISFAEAAVADGVLRLTSNTDGRLAIAEREVDPVLTDWTIRARMGRAANQGTVRLYWFTGNDDFPAIGVSLGPADDHNYRFLFWDVDEQGWFFLGDFSGRSDAVRDAPGEFTDLTIGQDDGDFFVMAGDTDLIRFTPNATFGRALRSMTAIWLAGGGPNAHGSTQRFDWIDVTGTESSADMSNRSGVTRRLDLAREALEASAAKPVRLKR